MNDSLQHRHLRFPIRLMTQHLWVNHQASDKMRKEKVLKTRKKTEEEDEFNGLVKKKDGRKKKQIQEAKKKALSDHRWQ